MLYTDCNGRKLVGSGNKGGVFFTLTADKGNLLWQSRIGPGGIEGGFMWGSATDNQAIYVSLTNSLFTLYSLPNGLEICSGSWVALNIETGHFKWINPVPGYITNTTVCATNLANVLTGGSYPQSYGPITIGQGLIYVGSQLGYYYILNSATGRIVWSYKASTMIMGGPALVGDYVFWGAGYSTNITIGGLYAFKLR